MCTSMTLPLPDGRQLFGRTLDWHEHFGEQVAEIPAGFPFAFGRACRLFDVTLPTDFPAESRYALLGTLNSSDSIDGIRGYPLFADACNEHGLSMAGLRFAKYALYADPAAPAHKTRIDLAPWELIPYLLGTCATMAEVRAALTHVRVVNVPFRLPGGVEIPNQPLHWQIASANAAEGSLVLEATTAGLQIYDAAPGVMANHPTYAEQLSAWESCQKGDLPLPGGYSSTDRFLRAAYVRAATAKALSAYEDSVPPVNRFLQAIAAVSPPLGVHDNGQGWQRTLYTACMDGRRGTYSVTSETNPTVRTYAFSAK